MDLNSKLNKGGSKVEQEESQPKTRDVSWVEDLVTEFGARIPIMPHIGKGSKSTSLHFWMDTMMVELAEEIVYSSHKRLRSISEVMRAASCIGLLILDKMVNKEDEKTLSTLISLGVSLEQDNEVIRFVIKCAASIKESFDIGMINIEERDRRLEKLTSDLPPKFRKAAWNRIEQVLAGKKISELSAFKEHGGKRGKAEGE
jgi:hypothetical protein